MDIENRIQIRFGQACVVEGECQRAPSQIFLYSGFLLERNPSLFPLQIIHQLFLQLTKGIVKGNDRGFVEIGIC